MSIKSIIDSLCSHEISKEKAISKIEKVLDTYRTKKMLEAEVEETSYSVSSDGHIYLKLRIPYSKYKWEDATRAASTEHPKKVDLIIRPE